MTPSDHATQGSRHSSISSPRGDVSAKRNERAHRLYANGYGTGNSRPYFNAPVTERLASGNQTGQHENQIDQYLKSWDEKWGQNSELRQGHSLASSPPECHPSSNNTPNYNGGIPDGPHPSSFENTRLPSRPRNPGGKEDAFHKLFHSISQWYRDWLRTWASLELPNQDGEEHPTTTGTASSSRDQSHRQQQRRDKRKREDGDRDSKKYDGNKRRGGSDQSPATTSQDEKLRLSCPFFKRDPMKYIDCQPCLHHWPNTSRLKEHLYHRHTLPGIQCGLCGADFNSQNSFQEHQLQSGACERLEIEPHEGIDALTRVKLQDKKTARGATEEEKWHAIYAILFPKDNPSTYPSPYYDMFPVVRQQIVRHLEDETHSIVENAVNRAILDNTEATTTPVARQLKTNITASITASINSYLLRFQPEQQPWQPDCSNGESSSSPQDSVLLESPVETARRDVTEDLLQQLQADLENEQILFNYEELNQFFDFSLSQAEHPVL